MPILDPNSMEFISRSAEQTRRVGMHLGALLGVGDVVCLEGDLGSGKTTLVQGMASGWGSLDAVSSPTFVLVNVYRGLYGKKFFHLDAYRLRDSLEAEALDVDVMLESGPLVVEWAERIKEIIPVQRVWVNLRWVNDTQRDMLFTASGDKYNSIVKNVRRLVYGVA